MPQPSGSASTSTSNQAGTGRVNQTPSTPLLFENNGANPLDIPDGPPPSYEEATGISPAASPAASPVARPAQHAPGRVGASSGSHTLHVPSQGAAGAGSAAGAAGRANNRLSVSSVQSGRSGRSSTDKPRPGSANPATTSAAGGPSSEATIPQGRQFPPVFSVYALDKRGLMFTLGEHQQSPLYAIRMQLSWRLTNPIVALHNGPNPETAPLLAAVDGQSLTDNMSITLPPPISYKGGSTACMLEAVYGWSRSYRFTIEVGTARGNVHMESFEWRHSFGSAIAALSGPREGWKLVRMSTARLGAGQPPQSSSLLTSDGREVVAVWSDAMVSLTKVIKFMFLGTGATGLLGERWSVMAVTSMLAIYEKEMVLQNRR